ncbi:MAG: hypothetical protein WCI48_16015 [Bacteroidota bacterium]
MNIYDYKDNILQLTMELEQLRHTIPIPKEITDSDLKEAYTKARALDQYLQYYFNDKSRPIASKDKINEGIDKIFEGCYKLLIGSLENVKAKFLKEKDLPDSDRVNLFELAGTEHLFLSNQYTRVITENLGHRFEEIASLSHLAFNHETELNWNIRGIDVIIFDGTNIRYTQLKTKRDTLTGSQVPRSNQELSIHQNSIFAAALDIGNGWTFNNRKDNLYPVTRLAGESFWKLIDIDYSYVLGKSKELMKKLEDYLYT